MKSQHIISGPLRDELAEMGQGIKLARLRRNLSQADIAGRTRLSRSTVASLEDGAPGTSVGALVAVLETLGLSGRLSALVGRDELGEELELINGRKRAGGPRDVAGF